MSDFFLNDKCKVLKCMASRQISINGEMIIKLPLRRFPKKIFLQYKFRYFRLKISFCLWMNLMDICK